jgi:hypothetical protein
MVDSLFSFQDAATDYGDLANELLNNAPAPITILIEEMPVGGTRVAYDSIASEISAYGEQAASAVARELDTEVLGLLRRATAEPSGQATT